MEENSPSRSEDGLEPFPDLIDLPHGHPNTSFASSQEELDRMAMPPPPQPCFAPATGTLNGSTPVFEPRVLHPFRLAEAGTLESQRWLLSATNHVRDLCDRTKHIISSLTMVRSLDEEMLVLNRAIEINEDGQRFYTHIIDAFLTFGGRDDPVNGIFRTDWIQFMDEEFQADAARCQRTGRDLLRRRALVEMQMQYKKALGHFVKNEADMARQGITGPTNQTPLPLAVGVPEPTYNQLFVPHSLLPPHFAGFRWPIHGPPQTTNTGFLSIQQIIGGVSATPERAVQPRTPPSGSDLQIAFAHQLEFLASQESMHPSSGGRHHSFYKRAQGSGPEFNAVMRSGNINYTVSRRPTFASHGSFEQSPLRRWRSNSPTKQKPLFGSTEKEWQDAQYNDAFNNHGKSLSQSPRRNADGSDGHQDTTLDKGKGRSTSPWKTVEATTENRGHQDFGSTSNKQDVLNPMLSSQTPDLPVGQNIDHSYLMSQGDVPRIENADMLATWGQQHRPTTLNRQSSSVPHSDVANCNLSNAASTCSQAALSEKSNTAMSAIEYLPPHLQWTRKPAPAVNEGQTADGFQDKSKTKEQHIPCAKPESNMQGKEEKRVVPGAVFVKPKSEASSASARPGPSEPLENPASHSSEEIGQALERTESNEWQVAQSRNKREPQAKANKKGNQPLKEKASRAENSGSSNSKKPKKGDGNDQAQGVESSNPGKKKGGKSGNPRGMESNVQVNSQGQSFESQDISNEKSAPKGGNSRNHDEYYSPDMSQDAFPSLHSGAKPSSTQEAEKLNWAALLKSQALRVEAEKLRVAAETVLPLSPDAILVQKSSVSEKNVSIPPNSISSTVTYASAASGSWGEHMLMAKQKTPGPKPKGSKGELRATATPFTPPATISSAFTSAQQESTGDSPLMHRPLAPTDAQRAEAESQREEPFVLVKSKRGRQARSSFSATSSADDLKTPTAGPVPANFGATVSYAELASRYQHNQASRSRVSLSEHGVSQSVPTSIAGSVSSPSISSAKSLPSTPMIPTYAQRAASASLMVPEPLPKRKEERPSMRGANTSTPKSVSGPRPEPLTPATPSAGSYASMDSPKTVRPSTSKSSLNGGARPFSYASKLAAPAPPVMSSLTNASKEKERLTDPPSKLEKTTGSISAPVSVRRSDKKGGTDKVRDPPIGDFPTLAVARTIPAVPIIPSWAQKIGKGQSKDRHTLLRLTTKQNKKAASALAHEPPPTIDATLMKVNSEESGRASFASTATTSASSATLVSSETISSESANSASVRENSDVGPPSPVHKTNAPYKPAKSLYGDGSMAPNLKSSVETWAQMAGHKTPQNYIQPPPMEVQERIELERESRLTTPTGARGASRARANEHWRGGKSGQARASGTGTETREAGGAISEVEQTQEETSAEVKKGQSQRHDDEYAYRREPSGGGRQGQRGTRQAQPAHERCDQRQDVADGSQATRRANCYDGPREPPEERSDSNDPASTVGIGRKASAASEEAKGSRQTLAAGESPGESTPKAARSARFGGGSGVADGHRVVDVEVEEVKSQPAQTEEGQASDGAAIADPGMTSSEESPDGGGGDSDDTVKDLRKRNTKTKQKRFNSKMAKAAQQEAEADQSTAKQSEPEPDNKEGPEAAETPTKVSWADADDDDDEWAGFDPMTSSDVKKQSERKGG